MNRPLVLAAALTVVLLAPAAVGAFQCPALITRAQTELGHLPKPKGPVQAINRGPEVKLIEARLAQAQAAHDQGQHEQAVKLATEALEMLEHVRRENR